jgi:hypothetical protein
MDPEREPPVELDDDKRSYFRVWTRVPLRARPVGPEEVEQLETEIRNRKAPPALPVDQHLAEWLDRIEAKLDRLLAHAGLGEGVPLVPDDEQDVLLSGGGMKFWSSRPYSPGTVLLLEFDLPTTPRHHVRTLARVVGNEPSRDDCEGYPTAVTFHAIHEIDRDAVVGHSLAVERAQLRSGLYRPRDGA